MCWLLATKPSAHPEEWDGVSSRKRKPSHIEAALWPRKIQEINV